MGPDLAGVERHPLVTLAAVGALAAVHLLAGRTGLRPGERHLRIWRSLAAGVAVAYVLVRLIPAVADSARDIGGVTGWLPYSDRHAFVLTLAGLVLFYGVRRMTEAVDAPHASAIRSSVALAAFSWLSFLTGFLLVEIEKPGLLPLVFFTLAIGVYFAVRDPSLAVTFGAQFDRVWRPVLVAALVAGWLVGNWEAVGPMPFTLLSAILAGGVILSVVREQLPDAGGVSFPVFVGAAAAYTVLLLVTS